MPEILTCKGCGKEVTQFYAASWHWTDKLCEDCKEQDRIRRDEHDNLIESERKRLREERNSYPKKVPLAGE
jgi:hypothetical protein